MHENRSRTPARSHRPRANAKTGEVVYKAEKDACRAFPDRQRELLAAGSKRYFHILSPLEFLAEFTRPGVPGAPFPPRAHLVRDYGWYSNKARALSEMAAEAVAAEHAAALASLGADGFP